MKNFIKILIIIFAFYLLSAFTVSAQSQSDISLCDFSASDTNNLYTQLNYSCKGIPWLPKTYEIYRKINMNSCPVTDEVDVERVAENTVEFIDETNGNSIKKGEYFVEDYMLFYTVADGSQRESISWFENQYSNNDTSKKTALKLEERKLPRPFLVTDEILIRLKDSPNHAELSKYNGFVMCPIYEIEGGKYQLDSVTKFKRADLVPPAAQEFENMVIDAMYLLWGFVFVYGVIRLSYIGFQFMYGGTSPERLGQLKASLGLWVVGLILVFLAVPLLSFIYSLVGINTSKCYKLDQGGKNVYDLSLPGFTFFFNDVCTGGFAASNS